MLVLRSGLSSWSIRAASYCMSTRMRAPETDLTELIRLTLFVLRYAFTLCGLHQLSQRLPAQCSQRLHML